MKGQIWELEKLRVSGAEYWMDEQFQNLPIFEIFIVFQVEKFWKFTIFKYFTISENYQTFLGFKSFLKNEKDKFEHKTIK